MTVIVRARRRFAPWVFCGLLLLGLCFSQAQQAMTLQEAVARVLKDHPQARGFDWQRQMAAGARQQAGLAPQLELGLELENIAGSGDMQGLDAAETTLSLSSVLELGGKREIRTALAEARQDQVQLEIEGRTLDLVGATTEHFVTALAAQAYLALMQEAVALDQATLAALQERARAGAASDADVHRAQAALARTRLALEQQQAELQIARVQLAALWGEPGNPPASLSGDLFALRKADHFDLLYARAQNSPVLRTFTQEERLLALNTRLARANARADLHWSLGLRHLSGSDDQALVAGLSLPLFSGQRARGEYLQAQARLGEVQQQKRQAEVELHSRLFEAYTRREQALTSALLLRDQLIPALTQAFELSRLAFERGRYTYLDLVAAQRELLEARRESIDSAARALLLGAALEQITAAPLSRPSLETSAE